jgi:hypothetical protein
MIVIRVELWSARTGRVLEIGRAVISNDGTGDLKRRNYDMSVFRRGTKDTVLRRGRVENFPSTSSNIWKLVFKAIHAAFPEYKI